MIKRLFTLINLVLITAAIFFGVKIFYGFVTAEIDAEVIAADVEAAAENRNETTANRQNNADAQQDYAAYQPVIERDLFKTQAAEKEKPDIDPSEVENLEETKLNLKLWGTITDNTEKSYAVIEDEKKREQQLYQKGDKIQQARIKVILRKKVVLTVDGKDEVLQMEDLVDQSHRTDGRSGSGSDRSRGDREHVAVERSEIDNALKNINQLMRQIRVRPYFEDGKPNGILLSGIRDNSIFEEMGLKSGDVVKAVNGKDIESVDDAMKFYQNLKSSSEVDLKIERNGNPQTINYRIQ
ncbi:MAG: type II secretion system protein GspC [Thermodesulfobacteriota bacterium]